MRACHRCQTPYHEPGTPGFNNTCGRCGMSLHACANCSHFVRRGSVRCLVPTAAEVMDPTAGNRCESFEFTMDQGAQSRGPGGRSSRAEPVDRDDARTQWDQLFGD